MRARVYFNLHKRRWSVQLKNDRGNWYVAFHADSVSLSGVVFKVSQAGRRRVIREGRKNVHAFAIGTLQGMWGVTVTDPRARSRTMARDLSSVDRPSVVGWDRVTYNPHRHEQFVIVGDEDTMLYATPGAYLTNTNSAVKADIRPMVWAS